MKRVPSIVPTGYPMTSLMISVDSGCDWEWNMYVYSGIELKGIKLSLMENGQKVDIEDQLFILLWN